MRPDQVERLLELEEKLADVVIMEADPDQWPGSGVPAKEMTQEERGDRFWCKKNANATMALLIRTISIKEAASIPNSGNEPPGDDDDLDKQIASAEKEAQKILNEAMASSRGK